MNKEHQRLAKISTKGIKKIKPSPTDGVIVIVSNGKGLWAVNKNMGIYDTIKLLNQVVAELKEKQKDNAKKTMN